MPGTWSRAPVVIRTLFGDDQDVAGVVENLCRGCGHQFTGDIRTGRRRPLRREEARRPGHRPRRRLSGSRKFGARRNDVRLSLPRRAEITQGKIDDVLCLLRGEPASALPVVGTLQGQSL